MVSPWAGCLSDNQINELVSGGLAEPALAQLESHIARCADCRGLVGARAASLGTHDVPVTSVGERLQERARGVGAPRGDAVWDDRYEIRAEVARGGMGRILEAWDRRHRRPVAIKVLLAGRAAIESRFAREVLLTARLQHPSIVALYDAGVSPEGEPFFVMKLVNGRSLAAVARDARTLESRLALLPHLIAATEALAYAHEQRIIHRDLKPANVLAGTFGETVVIDWGLAKELGAGGEAGFRGETSAEESDAPGTDPPADLTVAGHALGTPCYMPPEQARGEPADERADVYALGALLYHVLSGGPPFVEATSRDVIAKVLAGPPERLSKRAPGLPADLVTIVEKAMARTPSERYGTAREMAADLQRFTLGQLVAAHSYSTATLVRRWVRRHRAIVAMAVLLVAGVAITAGLSFRRVVRERDRADHEKVIAEERGRSARAHREAAEALVEYAVVELREELSSVGKLGLLSGLGDQVEKYYGSLSELEEASAPSTLTRRAQGLDLLGAVAMTKQNLPAARGREEQAVALLERALVSAPGDPNARGRLIETEIRVAGVYKDMGALPDAIAANRRAADEARTLLAQDPTSTSAQLLAVRAERSLADRLFGTGEAGPALEAMRAVPELLKKLAAADPAKTDLQLQLSDTEIDQGVEEGFYGAWEDMVATEREALAVLDRVALLLPDDARVQDQQGSALQLASGAEIVLGHADAALDLARRSVAIRERLVARDPDNANSGNSLSSAYACVAQSLRELGRSKEAEAFSLRALAINEAHVAKTPDSAAAQGHLGRVLDEVADTYVASGKRESALAALERSRAIFQRLADREPELTWRWLLASTIRKEAGTELALARVDRAVVDAAKANALAEAITPISDDEVLVLRAQTRGLLGEARVERGLRAEGRQSLLDALADFDLLWNRGRSRAEWFHGAPEAARALARVMVQSGEGTEARARLEAVLAPLEELEKAGRLTFDLRPVLAGVRGDLAGLAR